MTHIPLMPRDLLRASSRWSNSPNIHFVGKRTLYDVDKLPVGRPQRKMAVRSGRGAEDVPAIRSLGVIANEQRVSGFRRMVSNPCPIARPIQLGGTFDVRLRRSSQSRHCPNAYFASARTVVLPHPKRNQ